MSRCKEFAGFLFDHPCPNPVESNCQKCSKPICAEHARKGLCISCKRAQRTEADANDPHLVSSYYYSDYHEISKVDVYSRHDREAFQSAPGSPAGAGDWDKDWDSDFDGT